MVITQRFKKERWEETEMKTKITSMTTATLFITLMMTSLVGCGAISSNASETGASTLESISSDN